MKQCRLPQELISAIIDNFKGPSGYRDRHALHTLRTCSLVCRLWVPVCQRPLLHAILFTIWARRGTCTATLSFSSRLGQVLLSSPHLAGYIRSLTLCDTTCQTCGKGWMSSLLYDESARRYWTVRFVHNILIRTEALIREVELEEMEPHP
jgi:hypothetical protein